MEEHKHKYKHKHTHEHGGKLSRRLLSKIEHMTAVHAIRSGLIGVIPVLIIGAFALALKTFPVPGYQRFLAEGAGGFFLTLLDLVYSATFGALSVYMTVSVSRSYMRLKAAHHVPTTGAISASLLSFFILAGAYLPDFGVDRMGPKSMFLAILAGLGASWLYQAIHRLLRHRHLRVYSVGADRRFNRMLSTIVPVAATALVFALVNALAIYVFRADSFRDLLNDAFERLFSIGNHPFPKGFFFVLLSSLLWFFGIHGNNVLEGVMQHFFAPGLAANQVQIAAGQAPSAILTKEFFDCFVFMGGCGTLICLLITALLFSRDRARRGLTIASAFPMLFNINELMVFGLPIIFNPILLIPFIAVPLVCYTTSYLALSTGLVPLITTEVAWTTPILLSGFRATGSLAGSALQLVNVALGVLIYLPFVRVHDRRTVEKRRSEYNEFAEFFRRSELHPTGTRLIDLNDLRGDFARALCAELRDSLRRDVRLAYQPQYRYDGRCIGVEALLRWKHPTYGMLYPPLVIRLADEGGFLPELEELVLSRALADRHAVLHRFGGDVRLCVNVTGVTAVTARYRQFVRQLNDEKPFAGRNICLEITQRAALKLDQTDVRALSSLREMGLTLAVDNVATDQNLQDCLKDGIFDRIKLDGSLVRELPANRDCREIIESILRLAADLKLPVVAECVGTVDQREALHEIGCDRYQGYLYSPAVFLTDHEL